MRKRGGGVITVIGVFKLVKAALLIVVGIGAMVAMPDQLAHAAEGIAQWIGVSLDRDVVQRAVAKLSSMEHLKAQRVGFASLCYATVFLVEGVGLVSRRRWAEWLTVLVTGSFVPIEIYEMAKHFSAAKVVVLCLNVAIVAYLIWRRLQERSSVARVPTLNDVADSQAGVV